MSAAKVRVHLDCGDSFDAEPWQWEIRDRLVCPQCFDNGSPYKRYVIRIVETGEAS